MDSALINLIAAVGSAVAATASVIVAVVLGRRTEAISAAQNRQSAFSATAEWRRDLMAWAAEVVDVLAEAAYCCPDRSNEQKARELFVCTFRISALIDRGRFLLPNSHPEKYGTDKLFAFRGYRHQALDPLVAAERVLSKGKTGKFKDPGDALVAMKREFVSTIQRILNPQHFNREIARMITEGNEALRIDPTLGGLLPDNQNIPPGAAALLERTRPGQ